MKYTRPELGHPMDGAAALDVLWREATAGVASDTERHDLPPAEVRGAQAKSQDNSPKK